QTITGTYQGDSSHGTSSGQSVLTVNAAITLTPSTGGAGSTFTVAGSSFGANRPITIKWDGSGGTTLVTNPANCTSAGAGTFSCSTTVPSSASLGDHTIFATDDQGHTATAIFTVIRATQTTVSCVPGSINPGGTTTCTATLIDTTASPTRPS